MEAITMLFSLIGIAFFGMFIAVICTAAYVNYKMENHNVH